MTTLSETHPVPAMLPHLPSSYGPVPVRECCELPFLNMRVKQEENLDPAWVQDGLRALGRSLLTSRGVEGNDEIDPTRKAFLIHHKSPGQVDVSLGQLQNIVVVKLPPRAKETLFRAYGVICGNRRVAAAKLVNKESEKELIPVLNATILEVTDQQWNDQLIRFKFQLIAYTENNARQEMDAPERIYWLGMLRESYETLFPDSKKPGRSLPKTPNAVLPPEKSPRFDVLIKEMLHRSDSTTRADGKYFHQMSRTIFEWWHAMGLNVVAADEIITIPKPLQGRIREQIEARGLDPTLENIRKIIADEELRQEAKTQQPTIDRLCPEAVKEWWDKERLPFDAAEVLAQVPRIHQPKVLAAIPDDEPATQALITEIVEGNAVIQAAFQLERARAGLEPKVFEWYQANNLPYTVAERFFRIPIAMQPKIMETLKIQLADAVTAGTEMPEETPAPKTNRPAKPVEARTPATPAAKTGEEFTITPDAVTDAANKDDEVQQTIFEAMQAEAKAPQKSPTATSNMKTDCKNCPTCQIIDSAAGHPAECMVFSRMMRFFAGMTETCLRLCDEEQITLPSHLVPYVKRATLNLLTCTKSLNLHLARAFPKIEALSVVAALPGATAKDPTNGNGHEIPATALAAIETARATKPTATRAATPVTKTAAKTASTPAAKPAAAPAGKHGKNGRKAQ